MTDLTIKFKSGSRETFKMLLQLFFIYEGWIIIQYTIFDALQERNSTAGHLVFGVS